MTRQLRVLHTESSHGWGGQEIRILTESQQLIKRGHWVRILADPDSLIAQRASLYDVEIEPIKLKGKAIREIRSMVKAINRLKPDVISAHSSTDHWVAAIARLISSHRPSIVRTRHISTKVHRNLPTKWLYRSGCEAVVTTGQSIKDQLTLDGFLDSGKVWSIPTGIDLDFFSSQGKLLSRQRIAAAWPVHPDAVLFGNVATLRSWKGQHDLISAFSKVKKALSNAQLLIVGDGPQRGALQELSESLGIRESVIFCGHQQDVRDYLDALDVFVFPSYANEGIPQAVLQAMAYGLPIITTQAGSIAEATEGYPAVRFVQMQNPLDLSEAMLDFGRQAQPRSYLGELIRNRIGLSPMTERMIAIYRGSLPMPSPAVPS